MRWGGKKAGEALPEDLKTSPEEQLVERPWMPRLIWVRAFPPKQSLYGAPIFVVIDASLDRRSFDSLRSLRMTMVDLGSCFPTLAKLGWGTHSRGD